MSAHVDAFFSTIDCDRKYRCNHMLDIALDTSSHGLSHDTCIFVSCPMLSCRRPSDWPEPRTTAPSSLSSPYRGSILETSRSPSRLATQVRPQHHLSPPSCLTRSSFAFLCSCSRISPDAVISFLFALARPESWPRLSLWGNPRLCPLHRHTSITLPSLCLLPSS